MQLPILLPMLYKVLSNKKVAIVGLMILLLSATLIDNAYALDLTNKLTKVGTNAGYTDQSPNIAITIGIVIRALLSLLGVIFMAYIIFGGYKWLTARGNEENINLAKSTIRNGIVGLIIILSAYAISAFVISRIIQATGYAG